MTANEAAKACLARIVHEDGGRDVGDEDGFIQMEREFTEIISQVTPPLTLEQEMAWMAHQKQKNLNLWMGYNPADLCNANPYQPMPTSELLMRGTAPPFDTSGLSEQGRFPQEIEEPRSDTRGRGHFREDYFSLCSRHQVTDWNCHICQNGYWVNRVRMTEDEATREHLFGASVKEKE